MESNNQQPQIFQLVDDKGNLQQKQIIEDFLKKNNFYAYGNHYNIISIIGGQSSGKSTLLNHLFKTSFEVLNSKEKRSQTTKGIWIAQDLEKPLIIMDVEGSDSLQRGEDMSVFQTSTALFALALSQIFIVNIWCHDVGRFTGQQIGILRTIFEINIKLFKRDELKNILFVIRDFSDDDENFDYIRTSIINDIKEHVWDFINKPENMKDMVPDQLFNISVFTLKHIKFAKEEFVKGTEELRSMLTDQESQNYMFKQFDYSTNLPAEALVDFAHSVWDQIKSDKDINLPNQKILVSNIRCNQIFNEAIELIQEDIKNLNQQIQKGEFKNFGSQIQQILEKAQIYYNDHSKDYVHDVVDERRKELEHFLESNFFQLFAIYNRKFKDQLKESFKNGINSLIGQQNYSNINQNIKKIFVQVKEEYDNALINITKQLHNNIKIENLQIDENLNEFNNYLQEQIDNYIAQFLREQLKKLNKQVRDKIKKLTRESLRNIDNDFWDKLKDANNELQENTTQQLQKILQDDFGLSFELTNEEIVKFQKEQYQELFNELKQQSPEIYIPLVEKFKKLFEKKEDGVPRNWRGIKEEEINQLYKQQQEYILDVYKNYNSNNFKYLLNEDSQNYIYYDSDHELFLLSSSEQEQIQVRFQEQIEKIYKNAVIEQQSQKNGGIPKIFWFILVYFMYDDVFRWLSNWYFFFPIVMILFFVGFSISMGYKNLPLIILNELKNLLLKSGLGQGLVDQLIRLIR